MNQLLNITIDGVDYVAFPRKMLGDSLFDEESFDEAVYDRIKAQLDSGEEELMPAEFANRIVDGESPLRVWREFRSLTLQALADRVGVSKGYLSEIENGRKDGSVQVMKQVAETLGLNLDDII